LKSDCGESANTDNCVGGYGFTVNSDGTFQAGPGPNGQIRKGNLSPDDLNNLNTSMSAVLAGPRSQVDNHQTLDESSTNDTVTVVQTEGSDEQTIIHTDGTDMVYRTQSFDTAKTLLSSLHDLATKYYALPFPDACGDSANAVATLFSSLQTCTQDSDCGYFDSSMQPADASSNASLTTDDSTKIPLLVVGNSKAVNASMTKINEALDVARTTCGNDLYRGDSTGTTSIQLTGAAPVCRQGVCKAPNQ